MGEHKMISTWEHDSDSYTVTVHVEDGKAREVIYEQVADGEVRRTSMAAGGASIDEIAKTWSTSRQLAVLSFRVRQVLDIATTGQHRTP